MSEKPPLRPNDPTGALREIGPLEGKARAAGAARITELGTKHQNELAALHAEINAHLSEARAADEKAKATEHERKAAAAAAPAHEKKGGRRGR